jgi:hypothetical protein
MGQIKKFPLREEKTGLQPIRHAILRVLHRLQMQRLPKEES